MVSISSLPIISCTRQPAPPTADDLDGRIEAWLRQTLAWKSILRLTALWASSKGWVCFGGKRSGSLSHHSLGLVPNCKRYGTNSSRQSQKYRRNNEVAQ